MDKQQMEQLRGKEFLAASVPPETLNSEDRTVDIVFFTGADIPRVDFWTGERYTLRLDPNGADLSLLNNGAPILESHMWGGSDSQKGVVMKAWKDKKNYKATARFAKVPSVDELWQKVSDKIMTKFSMGVYLLEVERTREGDQQIHLAKRWQPYEISLTPIPADFGTTTLAAESGNPTNGLQPKKETTMSEHDQPGTVAGSLDADPVAEAQVKLAAEKRRLEILETERANGATAELARVNAILAIQTKLGLPASFAQKHIAGRTDIHKVRELAIEAQVERTTQFDNDPRTGRVMMIRDEQVTRRELMGTAIYGMLNPKERSEDQDNPFIGLTIKEIAQESVRLQYHFNGMPKMSKVIELSMQNTADFANVLENSARKQLMARYQYANPTYRLWTKRSTTPDFKTMSRARLGEAPVFLTVAEGGQITIGTMADSKETYALATYGRGVSFTRQMLINDDLGAFNDLIGAFGVQAARLENKTVYAILAANANMSDGVTLFHANHGNSGAGVIGNTALDAMFTAMAIQKGIDNTSVLNITPKFLIVPKAKEWTARAALLTIGPNVKASDQNLFAGRLEPVADAELDSNGSGTTKWYGAADPADAPGIEYAHLEGFEGPQFIRKENEQGILGIQFYAYLDFGAKAVDWRPLYFSTGA